MGIKSTSRSGYAVAIFTLSWLLACAPAPRLHLQDKGELQQTDVEKIVADNPLGANENIKVTTVAQGESVSHHIVQIRDRESPHIHKIHDGTVVMMRGRGYLMMENRRMDLSVGDVVYIPRGVLHYYVNSASEPTVAFVIFSPPFDGKDTIPVTAP
jgi:mannose-6-phosphate isomerase-like protein (cupin superfamily)